MTANPAADETRCPQTGDGYHCHHWQKGTGRCCACGQNPSGHPDDRPQQLAR